MCSAPWKEDTILDNARHVTPRTDSDRIYPHKIFDLSATEGELYMHGEHQGWDYWLRGNYELSRLACRIPHLLADVLTFGLSLALHIKSKRRRITTFAVHGRTRSSLETMARVAQSSCIVGCHWSGLSVGHQPLPSGLICSATRHERRHVELIEEHAFATRQSLHKASRIQGIRPPSFTAFSARASSLVLRSLCIIEF